MAVREYIGARYVPLFADDPWTNTVAYEPLTIVLNEGNSYTSRQYVPIGIDISNEEFWALTGNFNAQVEAYRKEVQDVKNGLETEISNRETQYSQLSQSIEKLDSEIQGTIVLIGDSFSDSSRNTWMTEFASSVNKSLKNYAETNAGFVRTGTGGHTFITELDVANADASFDNTDVDYVICYGGYNDFANNVSSSDMMAAVDTFCTNAKTYFPKSKVIVATLNWGNSPVTAKCHSFSSDIANRVNLNGCRGYDGAYYWLNNTSGVFQSDNLHPNATGGKIISASIQALINGEPTTQHYWLLDYDNVTILPDGGSETSLAVTHSGDDVLMLKNGVLSLSTGQVTFEVPANSSCQVRIPYKSGSLSIEGYMCCTANPMGELPLGDKSAFGGLACTGVFVGETRLTLRVNNVSSQNKSFGNNGIWITGSRVL